MPCALTQAVPAVNDVVSYTAAACAALHKPGAEDHWYFAIYRLDAKGAQLLIPFSSHPWYTKALQGCASQGFIRKGWIPDDADISKTLQAAPKLWIQPEIPKDIANQVQGFLVESKSFGYIPSADRIDVTGRLVRLELPRLDGRNGDLAIRLEVSSEGEVLDKKLLFSSDAELGRLVIENLESGFHVEKTGTGPGPFFDILSMQIQNGELAVLLQTHHSKPRR
jgi:hypothetical protein